MPRLAGYPNRREPFIPFERGQTGMDEEEDKLIAMLEIEPEVTHGHRHRWEKFGRLVGCFCGKVKAGA